MTVDWPGALRCLRPSSTQPLRIKEFVTTACRAPLPPIRVVILIDMEPGLS